MSFYIRIGNHVRVRSHNNVHRRAIFSTMCFVMAITLGTATGLFNASETVHANSVRGSGAEIYWDQGCTNRTLSFDWGPIEPGSNKILAVYIRNEGLFVYGNVKLGSIRRLELHDSKLELLWPNP